MFRNLRDKGMQNVSKFFKILTNQFYFSPAPARYNFIHGVSVSAVNSYKYVVLVLTSKKSLHELP